MDYHASKLAKKGILSLYRVIFHSDVGFGAVIVMSIINILPAPSKFKSDWITNVQMSMYLLVSSNQVVCFVKMNSSPNLFHQLLLPWITVQCQ